MNNQEGIQSNSNSNVPSGLQTALSFNKILNNKNQNGRLFMTPTGFQKMNWLQSGVKWLATGFKVHLVSAEAIKRIVNEINQVNSFDFEIDLDSEFIDSLASKKSQSLFTNHIITRNNNTIDAISKHLTLPTTARIAEALTMIKATVKQESQNATAQLTKELNLLGYSKVDISLIRHAFKHSEISINLKPKTFIEIMSSDSPAYKSIYETKMTGGFLSDNNNYIRKQVENNLFPDYGEQDTLEPKEHAKYGSICPIPFEYGGATRYGKVAIIFNEDLIRNNVTMTADDSWQKTLISVGDLDHPDRVLLDRLQNYKNQPGKIKSTLNLILNYSKRQHGKKVQIHENIHTKEEIKESSLRLKSKLKEKNNDQLNSKEIKKAVREALCFNFSQNNLDIISAYVENNLKSILKNKSKEPNNDLILLIEDLMGIEWSKQLSKSLYFEGQIHTSNLELNSNTVKAVRVKFKNLFGTKTGDKIVKSCQKLNVPLIWATEGKRFFIDPRTQKIQGKIPQGESFNEIYEQISPAFKDSIGIRNKNYSK